RDAPFGHGRSASEPNSKNDQKKTKRAHLQPQIKREQRILTLRKGKRTVCEVGHKGAGSPMCSGLAHRLMSAPGQNPKSSL
ncbi:hypothetical protein, partial [Bradyrhizobium sp. WSM2254]|uniref:hypothetical protein n=1 Tax=Bradyrhizobium sp. WSM2254 TaxID=1188263 RepID=UPI001AEBAAE7